MGSGTASWSTNSNVVRIGPNGTNNKLEFYHYSGAGATPMLSSSTIITDSAWHHGAIVRDGTDWELFVDGASEDTYSGTNPDTDLSDNGYLYIGKNGWDGSDGDYEGYMDEIRISDTARYTSNFTPQTRGNPFTTDANTLLLIHSDYTGGLGGDHSGMFNTFSGTNLTANDMMPDSPMNLSLIHI